MSLYGSLFSGVTGINAQGNAIGSISDNISNINTIGYKAGSATFSSLVISGAGGVAGSSGGGGSTATTRLSIDGQGLIQPTGISTDVAIAGKGFLVVNEKSDTSGEFLYTRAGSFRLDNQGNFINAAGYYLMAWPLDNEGRLPGAAGNANTTPNARLDSLNVVNSRGSAVAQATTRVEFGLNLNASEERLRGQGEVIEFPLATGDFNGGATFSASDIIVPGGATSGLLNGDELDITVNALNTYTFTYGGFAESDSISGANQMFGASAATTAFTLDATNEEGDVLRITTDTYGTVDFTLSASPNPVTGRFNSLESLAEAINTFGNTSGIGLTARIANNRLYVSSLNANDSITFANVNSGGGTATDIVAEFGLVNIAAGNDRFNSLDSLKAIVDQKEGLGSLITSSSNDPQMTIYALDPLATIQYANGTLGVGSNGFVGATSEFGLTAGVQDPVYNALGIGGSNMASGDVTPQFSRNVRLYDALGVGHDFRYSAVKIDNNQWAVEIYAANPEEIVSTRDDGLVAYGTLTFNGDGSLRNISAGLTGTIEIPWANDALPSDVEFDFGTAGFPAGTPGATEIGLTDGVSQYDGAYDVRFIDQNGAGSGLLTSVSIDPDGFIFFNYSNGQSRAVYKIPLADFPNINGLKPVSGNAYAQADESGEFTLKGAGESGVGVLTPESLENSATELADELTKMIVAQRSYQANTKTITTVDGLLEELTQLLR